MQWVCGQSWRISPILRRVCAPIVPRRRAATANREVAAGAAFTGAFGRAAPALIGYNKGEVGGRAGHHRRPILKLLAVSRPSGGGALQGERTCRALEEDGTMPVISVSRQVGSGATEVVNRLRDELGLVAFDKRLMLRVAEEVGMIHQPIVDFTEEQYKARGFFERLFSQNRSVAEVSTWAGGSTAGFERETTSLDELQAVALSRATIQAAYKRGNVIIVGRGSQVILEGKPDVLHLRLVAPFEARVQYLAANQNMSAAQARRTIQEQDRATAEFLRQFYNADVEDPTLYHMVLNVAALGLERCVALVKATVRAEAAEEAA